MYAITGITGQVGSIVAEELLSHGQTVRAVARDAGKAGEWVARGCSLALADMTDVQALTNAFEGVEGVFVLIPPIFDSSPEFAEVRAVIDAVRGALLAARPTRIVVLSTVGAQAKRPSLLAQLGLMERSLNTIDLPITFLRAAWFMENAGWDVESARRGVIESFLQPLDRAIPMVATKDIGVQAARLLREDWTGRRIVELQGPSTISPVMVAAQFAELLGHPVQARAVPRESWETLFREQGMLHPLARMQMLDGFNEGWIAFQGGVGVQQATGATALETVLHGLLARG